MARISEAMLRSKFKGALVGALIGDCFGAPYEGNTMITSEEVQQYFDEHDIVPPPEGMCKQYTDDTAMTKCVTNSLIEKKDVDPLDLAQKFVAEYKSSPRRGYGSHVISVFHKLHTTNYRDPFEPAQQQFGGRGSYGNGAAMRITPVALFYHQDKQKMMEMAGKVSKLTHAHELGVNGAVLQSLAVRKCLLMNPKDRSLDIHQFTDELLQEMKDIEKNENRKDMIVDPELEKAPRYSYENQFYLMQYLIKNRHNPREEEVVHFLGNFVSSLFSVPTALYVFLRAQGEIPGIETDNPFRRTIQYAVALGGDTDTIGSMAGAMAGAYFGYEVISESLQKQCEYINETIESADNLFTTWIEKDKDM